MIKKIAINNDPNRVITFNPYDQRFINQTYRLIKDLNYWLTENVSKATVIDVEKVDAYVHQQIDSVFGIGASKKIFGEDHVSVGVIRQFFEGITRMIPMSPRLRR